MALAWCLAALLSIGQSPSRQALPSVSGVVVDARTSQPIADARVVLVELARSAQTASDGRFEFQNVAAGSHTLTISIIGYSFARRQVDVRVGSTLDVTIPLAEGTGSYQETVTVAASAAGRPEVGVASQSDLGSASLQDLRGIAADDPMRAMQALPGVATGDDFQAQFSVRGSQFRHVGVIIDGTATPLLLHTVRSTNDTGSIAMINSDVLDRASLMAGAHPERQGDWLGATLDFGMREGSRDRTQVRLAVSGTNASAVVEGPFGRAHKGSWLASVRKSYIDWLVRKIDPNIDGTLGFADTQGKLTYDVTRRQQVQLMFVAGDARFRNQNTSLANGLATGDSKGALVSAAWRYANERWLISQRVSFVGSRFSDLGLLSQELGSGYARALVWRGDADWFVSKRWSLQFGGKSESQHQTLTQRNFVIVSGQPRQRFIESSADNTTLSSGWGEISGRTAKSGLSIGTRVTADTLSGRTVASPWLLGERTFGPLVVRAGAGVSHQFPELEYQRALPERVPERAEMIDVSVEHQLPRGLSWQLTGFSRHDFNILRRTGEDRLVDGRRRPETTFPQFASTLEGPSRGFDVLLSRHSASGLTGWISYTYAHTRYHDRVSGEDFDGDFDQRHTVNVFVQQRLSYRMTVNAKLRTGSNFPLVGYFQGSIDDLKLGPDRNEVRLPAYARLDVRANRTFTFDRRRLTLFLELMNVTGRDNVGQGSGTIRGPSFDAVGYTEKLIPFVPSAGVLIEF
jgi:hypothetical protein